MTRPTTAPCRHVGQCHVFRAITTVPRGSTEPPLLPAGQTPSHAHTDNTVLEVCRSGARRVQVSRSGTKVVPACNGTVMVMS